MQLFLQTYGENRNSGFILDTYGKLCVLTKTTSDISHNSFPMDVSLAESLVVQFWEERAAQPMTKVVVATESDSDEPPVHAGVATESDSDEPPVHAIL